MIEYVPSQRAMVVPFAHQIAAVVPQAPTIVWKKHPHHVLRHDDPTTLLLRQLGMQAVAPIDKFYDWNNQTPFDSQRATASEACLNRRLFVLNELGTGKTRAVLYAFDWMKSQGLVRRAVVTCPLSIMETVWQDEVRLHFPHLSTVILHGTADRRRKLLKGDFDIYIVNHHGMLVCREQILARGDIDLFVVDELAVFRNQRTDLWKTASTLAGKIGRVWGMTGNPTPNAPTDAYSQLKLVRPEQLRGQSFRAFREQHMLPAGPFKWLPRKGATEAVASLFSPAVRFKRSECVDLPPTMTITHRARLSDLQDKVMRVMLREMAVSIDKRPVTAANAGVLLSKLVQIATGVVYDGGPQPIVLGAPFREKLLAEVLEGIVGKALVFVPFRALGEHLHKLYPGSALVHGGVPRRERVDIFREFQGTSRYPWLIAQPACMAHGLTLTAATVTVWYAPITAADIYEQANGRMVRPGQKNNTYIVNVEGCFAERRIYQGLAAKDKWASVLLDVIKQNC